MIEYFLRVVPHAHALVAAGMAVALAETVLLILAALRWRATLSERKSFGRWPEWIAAAGPTVLLAAAAWSIHTARVAFETTTIDANATERARLFADSLAGQLNAVPIGVLIVAPALLLASIAIAFHVSARRQLALGTCLLVSLGFGIAGLGPFLGGAYRYSLALIHMFAGLAGVDVSQRAAIVGPGVREARSFLDRGASIGVAGFVVVAISAAVLLRRRESRAASDWGASVACLIAAVVTWAAARPLCAENRAPWPAASQRTELFIAHVRTPDFEGSDRLDRAPVISITPEQMDLDGQPEAPESLARDLLQLRRNYEFLFPNEPFNGLVDVVCTPETDIARVRAMLGAVARATYGNVSFVLQKSTMIERPLLGPMRQTHSTATRALLIGTDPPSGGQTTPVELGHYTNCGALVRAIDGLRREGKWPVLK